MATIKLALSLLFMRTVAEWFVLGEATTAEFWVLHCSRHIAISIDKIDGSGNANGSAFRVDKDFDVLAHGITF